MNAQETERIGYSKAVIALVAALSCLIIYILACVSSPVAWSPDSSQIALLVTPVGEDPNRFAIFVYDIEKDARVLLDEVGEDGILSAPAWSPDGKWIAYYRVEPSPQAESESDPNADPNASAPSTETTRAVSEKTGAQKTQEKGKTTPTVEELFSEENKILPPYSFDIWKEQWAEKSEVEEIFDVKLMVVKPDGKEGKVLRVLEWIGDEDTRKQLVLTRPKWSEDSKRLFYARAFGSKEYGYISSLNIATGQMEAHVLGSLDPYCVSPDNKWIASLLKTESERVLLTVARVDGDLQKYYKLDPEIPAEHISFATEIFWSPDLSKILFQADEATLRAIDLATGEMEQYGNHEGERIVWPMLSSIDGKLYYVTGRDTEDLNSTEQIIEFKRMSLEDKKTDTVFMLTQIPELDEEGRFFISPNGKMVLLRCVLNDEAGRKKTVLIFWDGKAQKIVETDPWLMEIQHTP